MAGRKKSFREHLFSFNPFNGKKVKRKTDKEEDKDDFQHEAEQEAKDADNGTIPKEKVNKKSLLNTTHHNTVLKSTGQDVVLKISRTVVCEQEEQADGDETVQEPVQADSSPTVPSLPSNHDIPREISKHVSEWKRFGRFLRFSDGRLNQIEIEHSKCYNRVYAVMTEFCHPEPINNSWSFWKKYLLQYPEGDKIIREIEITVPEVINEARTCHLGICQNNGLLFHHHMSIEKSKPLPTSSDKQIAVNIGGGGVELVHYQNYKDFMKTAADYFNLYEMFSDIRTFDFTTSDRKKCSILKSIQCFFEQSKHDGFAYKGYSLRNHYTLFGEYDVPQEEINNNILAYVSNDNVLIHIKTCDDMKNISRTLNGFLLDVQFSQAVYECISNSPIIHIGVVVVDDNILNDNNAFVCYQCVKHCLILPKSTFSTEEGFTDWYDNVTKTNESFKQIKNSLNSINQTLKTDISTELKRNIISQMALKSFDFPSFTPLPDYQMKELEKLVLLTAEQMEILHSPHKHIMIKGSYGSGKSLVLQERFKQTLQESGDNDIFYLICHDQMSQFAKQMKLLLKQYPDKLILVCNGGEISNNEIMSISDLLKYIRETWKSRRVHVYIDEFNGEYLDKEEVYKIKKKMEYFKNSHIVIAVQSMEYTFYKKSKSGLIEKDRSSFPVELLAKETSFCVYQLEYSFRCSVEINTFVDVMSNYLGDEVLKFVKTENACNGHKIILDRELTLENDSHLRHDTGTNIYYRYCYNTAKHFGHNVSSDQVKVYSPDQELLLKSLNYVKMVLFHIFACMEKNFVVSTFDENIFCEVSYVLDNSKCKWTTVITDFIAKDSSFQVLLTDYASIRGFEFPNVIALLGSDHKFLKFRLVECLTRATTNLSLVLNHNVHELLGLLDSWKDSNFFEFKVLYFDHGQDIYYFQSNDEIEKEILEHGKSWSVSAEPTWYNELHFRRDPERLYPWSDIKPRKFRHETDYLKSTFEIIFKQDNVKLFEDLVHLHSIDILEWKMRIKFNYHGMLHFAAKYNASNLCTLICNQHKQLVNSYNGQQTTPLEVAVEYNSHLVATVLLEHGALPVAAKYKSDRVASILRDHYADINREDCLHDIPLHVAVKYTHYKRSKLLLDRGADVNIQNKQTPYYCS